MARTKKVKVFEATSVRELNEKIEKETPHGYNIHKAKKHLALDSSLRTYYSITIVFKENKSKPITDV